MNLCSLAEIWCLLMALVSAVVMGTDSLLARLESSAGTDAAGRRPPTVSMATNTRPLELRTGGLTELIRKQLRLAEPQDQVCRRAEDGHQRWMCPTERDSRYCIDDHQMCDGRFDCPNREDEHPVMCLFYHAMTAKIRHIVRGFLYQRRH